MTPPTNEPVKLNGNGNGNGDVTKLLRWSSSIVGILVVFTGLIWYGIDIKLAPIQEALNRYNVHFIAIHDWQKEKGERIAVLDAINITIEKRVDKLESRP